MAHYLLVEEGPHRILIPTAGVIEARGAPAAAAAGHRPWRDSSLPVTDAAELLNLPPRRPGNAVILGQGERRCFLDVERVIGQRVIDETAFQRLPPLPTAVAALFDGAVPDGDGPLCLLRLRVFELLE